MLHPDLWYRHHLPQEGGVYPAQWQGHSRATNPASLCTDVADSLCRRCHLHCTFQNHFMTPLDVRIAQTIGFNQSNREEISLVTPKREASRILLCLELQAGLVGGLGGKGGWAPLNLLLLPNNQLLVAAHPVAQYHNWHLSRQRLLQSARILQRLYSKAESQIQCKEAKSNDGERRADPTSPVPILCPILHGDPHNQGSTEGGEYKHNHCCSVCWVCHYVSHLF